jgi:hypothetical protein
LGLVGDLGLTFVEPPPPAENTWNCTLTGRRQNTAGSIQFLQVLIVFKAHGILTFRASNAAHPLAAEALTVSAQGRRGKW